MRRFTLILALVLMVAMPMMAERVTPETARKVATTFLSNNGAKAAQLTDLSKAAGFPNLYIFTAEQGFVVMAADDCVQPILGYSLTGSFIAEDMPDHVRGWLQGYNDGIQYAIDSKMSASTETAKLWKELIEGNSKAGKATVVVAPMIQTKWSQNKYYNALCPEATGGPEGHAYTGCVATAMAQIMKYWGYPAHGIGSHSYTWNEQTLSADFGNTNYDWNNMANYYQLYYANGTDQYGVSVSNTPEQITAVATLMYHCGVAVDMNYGGGGSGAASSDAAIALKTYFNYSSNIEYKQKSSYEDAAWIQMVKDELNAQRPLEYSGRNGTGINTTGHSFVCDGYDNADYFHFNWGWWGHYDGYFSLSNLDTGANGEPGSGNGVYTYVQSAIFGIQPASNIAAPANLTYTISGLQDITLTWDAVSAASSYNVYRNGNLIGNVSENTYSETAPFGTYTYFVRSVDANGQLSLGSNTVSVTIDYLTPIVDDLTGTLSGNSVNLSWTAPEWCYPETPSATLAIGTQQPSNTYVPWGNDTYYWGHRHLAGTISGYDGMRLYSVDFHANNAGTYEICIYKGSSTSSWGYTIPSTLIASQTISVTETGWNTVDFISSVIIDGGQDLWVFVHNPEVIDGLSSVFCTANGNEGCYYTPDIIHYTQNSFTDMAFLIKAYVTDGTYTYNLYQDGTRIGQNLSGTTANATLNNNAANLFTVKTNFLGIETEASNKIGFAKGNASLASLNLDANDKMTITEGSKLTINGTLSDVSPENLILENGAQLVNSSTGVQATVRKNIGGYGANYDAETNNNANYYLIASPITENIAPTAANGLLTDSYDLYTFDQSEEREWRNYEADPKPFTAISNKVGYLYASSDETTLTFTGTLTNTTTATTLVYNDEVLFAGFNLIGNPFPCEAYINRSFYAMNSDGSNFIESSGAIPPCTAVLVQVQDASDISVTFSKTASKTNSSIVAQLKTDDIKGSNIIDQARVNFNENNNLVKYSLDKSASSLYFPQEDNNFAAISFAGQSEMPLNFKVKRNGSYTLSFELENADVDYLHLIDNMTGNDIDLLTNKSYTFKATTNDYASRFKLVFSNSENAVDNSESFAYVSNGEIVINQEGTLQIVDMMGHILICTDVARNVSTSRIPAGMYVLRLINGDNVKTQKIVVQ